MLSDLKFQENQVFFLQNNGRFSVRKRKTFINQDKKNTKVEKPLLLKLVNTGYYLHALYVKAHPPLH